MAAKPADTAAVRGVVSKDPTGEPVKKALIELIANNQSAGHNYAAETGTDGMFRIEGIVPGRYQLSVERTGFLEFDKRRPRPEGRSLTLVSGQELNDLVIHLQAAAVVEGRVTDEDGDALANADVAVMRQTYVSGRSRWAQVGADRTNDLGDYRIPNLPAGSYYVSVSPPPDFRSMIETAGNLPEPHAEKHGNANPQLQMSYVTTYYPGTKDHSQATAIQLHAGDDFPLNFSLTRSPSVAIRGSLANLPAGAVAMVILRSREFGLTFAGTAARKDGTFEIRDVAPGDYAIIASVPESTVPLMARQTLRVAGQNVEGLRLVPQPGSSIRGRLRLEGGPGSLSQRPDPCQFLLSLHDADADGDETTIGDGSSETPRVNPDGSFEWKGVQSGRYYLQLNSAGGEVADWFVKSVVAGGREVSETGLAVNGGSAFLDVVASSSGAAIDGVVSNSKDESVANAVVVAVPEPRLRKNFDRFRIATSDQRGRFTLAGLAPGQYSVFAWENIEGEAYYNPEFLKVCEGQGKMLGVREGEHANVQIKVIPEGEDQP